MSIKTNPKRYLSPDFHLFLVGDVIPRREIDVRPVVGAAVIFVLIGVIVLGIYYFALARPRALKLEDAKASALRQINLTLAPIGTDQATAAASSYSAQVREAGSESEVESILVGVTSTAKLERKRKELLGVVDTAANGTYYSASSVPALAKLLQDLSAGVNAKGTESELDAYKTVIDNQATSTWQAHFTGLIEQMVGENLVMTQSNSLPFGEYVSKSEALARVGGHTWQTLRRMKFENHSTIQVPVTDTLSRAPSIKPGSTVKVYVYDKTAENLYLLYANATVRYVIFSSEDLATIAWTLAYDTVSKSYSTNMWEALKAAAAGSTDAAAIDWREFSKDLIERALSAGVEKFDVATIYVVEVPDAYGELILKFELFQSAVKDIVLVPLVS